MPSGIGEGRESPEHVWVRRQARERFSGPDAQVSVIDTDATQLLLPLVLL